MLRVALADDAKNTLALNNLAVFTNCFYGRSHFHISTFASENNAALVEVVFTDFYDDLVSRQNLDKVHPHLATDVGQDDVTIRQLHSESGIR
jgi:hypothetical protein